MRRFFSLLEIMIVIFILSLIGSSLSVVSFKRIFRQRFYVECERFEKALMSCRKISLLRQMDTQCEITNTKKGIIYTMDHILLPKDKNIISHAFFQVDNTKLSSITIAFTPTGCVDPNCLIEINSTKNILPKVIPLQNTFQMESLKKIVNK